MWRCATNPVLRRMIIMWTSKWMEQVQLAYKQLADAVQFALQYFIVPYSIMSLHEATKPRRPYYDVKRWRKLRNPLDHQAPSRYSCLYPLLPVHVMPLSP